MKKKVFVWLFLLALISLSVNSFAINEKTLKELDTFGRVLHYVENEYVEDVNSKTLIEGAIKGMLKTLDPHTTFLSEDVYTDIKADTSGRFGGIGVEITVRDGYLVIVAPIEGSPSDKVGIEPQDKIVRINGKNTKDLTLAEAAAMIRGKRGGKVDLTVIREGHEGELNFSVKRTTIHVPSVKYEVMEDEYGYIRIVSFQTKTAKELKDALKQLHKKGDIKGLILDLRRNPGGLLDEAVKVSDLFLDSGVIVSTESRNKVIEKKEAQAEGTEPYYPMIVLVDGGSASAAEIVAGALQDHNRAVVLGMKSFGKGSVQTIIDLDNDTALKITIALYFTPSGRSIQVQGIIPDIEVPYKAPPEAEDKKFLTEVDLKGHLQPKEGVSSKTTVKDYQKKVALDYLKSWDVFKEKQTLTNGKK